MKLRVNLISSEYYYKYAPSIFREFSHNYMECPEGNFHEFLVEFHTNKGCQKISILCEKFGGNYSTEYNLNRNFHIKFTQYFSMKDELSKKANQEKMSIKFL